MSSDRSVATIIAAHNAASWIAKAIRSALAQPEVGDVVVVDDASTDGTARVAADQNDGTGRLHVLRNDRNLGPSASRNLALARSDLPWVAILDADDFFLPNRIGALLAVKGGQWDLAADNPVRIHEKAVSSARFDVVWPSAQTRSIGPTEFVLGNLPQKKGGRSELGFLKPVMRRDFLVRHGLGYREEIRLGEDYALYLEALLCGARFEIANVPGYVALERGSSLSGRHAVGDLIRLTGFDRHLLAEVIDPGVRAALSAHIAFYRKKIRLRSFLHVAKRDGRIAALSRLARNPRHSSYVLSQLAQDKMRAAQHRIASSLPVSTAQQAAGTPLLDEGFFAAGRA